MRSLTICYLLIVLWYFSERVKRSALLQQPVVYHNRLHLILIYIHNIQKYSCLPSFEGTKPVTKQDMNPSPQCLSSSFRSRIYNCPCRDTCSYNPDQSWLRLTAEKHKEASQIFESQRKQKWRLKSRLLSVSSKQKQKIRELLTFISSVAYQNRWQNSH